SHRVEGVDLGVVGVAEVNMRHGARQAHQYASRVLSACALLFGVGRTFHARRLTRNCTLVQYPTLLVSASGELKTRNLKPYPSLPRKASLSGCDPSRYWLRSQGKRYRRGSQARPVPPLQNTSPIFGDRYAINQAHRLTSSAPTRIVSTPAHCHGASRS